MEASTQVERAAHDLLIELVGIDSVNPGLVPGASGESRIVARLDERLRNSGFDTSVLVDREHPGRPSLIAIGPGAKEAPTIVLNGHVDTVGVEGMANPFEPRIEDDKLFARGAADMKGGIAAMVVAAEAAVAAGSPVRPVLALVADEEDASIGSAQAIATLDDSHLTADLCLIAEPTDLAICRSLRGFGVVKVQFPGRAAHSSQPENGVNAVTHLGGLLHRVEARATELRKHGGDLMATSVAGGQSTFVIPDSAECIVEMRTPPGQAGAQALDEVTALLDPDWGAHAQLLLSRDGWQLDGTGPAAEFAHTLGTELGTGPTFDAPYWMEAPMWQEFCPTLVCGPSGGGLHAVDEWVDLQQVRSFAQGLTTTLLKALPHRSFG